MAKLTSKVAPATVSKKRVRVDVEDEDTPLPVKKTAPAKKVGLAARKKVAGAPVRTPPPKFFYEAPPDFKPAFFEVTFFTGSDGMISPDGLAMTRVKGNWAMPESKRFDMSEYDAPTMMATLTRFAALGFASNPLRRFPGGIGLQVILRVNRRSATGTLSVIVKSVSMRPAGKTKWRVMEDKTDPTLKRLRRCARLLPSAFVQVQLPPSRRKTNQADTEE